MERSSTLPSRCSGSARPDGTATPITISTPGGSANVTFEGSGCRRTSVKVTVTGGTLAACNWSIELRRADTNALVGSTGACGATGFLEPVELPVAGDYKVVVTAKSTSTGSADVRIYDVVDLLMPINDDGNPVVIDLPTPGQKARLTFSGTTGQRVSLLGTDGSINGSLTFGCDVSSVILKPDESPIAFSSTCMEVRGFMDVKVLPADGLYAIVIDPVTTATGLLTLKLFDVPADINSTLSYGTAFPVNIQSPGQNGTLQFVATQQNQRITMLSTAGISGSIEAGCDVWASVRDPNNVLVTGSSTCLEGGAFMEVIPRWTVENRQFMDRAKPAISRAAETSEFYFVPSSVRKSVCSFVRQLRGPHLSTCA